MIARHASALRSYKFSFKRVVAEIRHKLAVRSFVRSVNSSSVT